MMNISRTIILGILLVVFAKGTFAQPPADCPVFECFASNISMANSCEEINLYTTVKNIGATINFTNLAITMDFGDGSAPVILYNAPLGPAITIASSEIHVYPAPGFYTVTVTVIGGNTNADCSAVPTTFTFGVESVGFCEICGTYSVLSTGYDDVTTLPIAVTPTSSGTDPNWTVFRRFDLVAPNYTPNPTTATTLNAVANVIYPDGGNCPTPPLGRSRYISVNTSSNSSYASPNIHTYRRYFIMPSPLPTSSLYSLLMYTRSKDYIFDVQVNGYSIYSTIQTNTNGAVQFNANSCDAPFLEDSNFIDVTVADINAGSTQLDAEILLYDCPLIVPCEGGGWSYNWTWSSSWGQNWGNTGGGGGGGGVGGGGGGVGGGGGGYVGPPPFANSGIGTISCANCITSFAPIQGKKYMLSAWVKEQGAAQSKTSYTYPKIKVLFPSISDSVGPFVPVGSIIDGWQRIEAEFTIPIAATNIGLRLYSSTGTSYFDDVRVIPFDGSMKSYVYDPVNLKLIAELDERNFATLYEYDEEGKLIRVKKETERGKMTIKESRENTQK